VAHPALPQTQKADALQFLKRTLDIAGVGVLEPSEVWHPTSHMASTTNLFTSSSTSDDGHLPAGRSGRPHSIVSSLTSPLSPTSTRTDSQDRSSFDTKKPSLDLRRLNPAGMMGLEGDGGGKTKQFFGKIFKKKAPQELDAPQPALGRRISPTPSYNSMESTLPPPNPGMNGHHPVLHVKAPSTASASITTEHPHGSYAVGHPTFGTAPLIVHRRSSGTIVTSEGAVTGLTGPISLGLSLSNSSAISADRATALPMLPSTKPVGYTWTVRKWAKKNTDGWAAHLVAAAAAGLEMVNGAFTGEADDEVVFEWVKMRAPFGAAGSSLMRRYSAAGTIASNRARSRSRGGSTLVPNGHTESPSPPRAPVSLAPPKRADSPLPPSSPLPSPKLGSRPEPVRRVSASTSPASKAESASETELIAEEGDDSDPEDSETPWACSIWVKKTGHRQLLGTLTPAPHHPKVIGVLKIPMGLDPVALTDVQGTGARQQEMASKVREEVSLAEENLKDVVCVTAMWLVAREEFGGLGKKRKV